MNETMLQEILNRLDALSAKLGVAAHALFALYVRQAYIDGIESVLIIAAMAVAIYFLVKITLRLWDQIDELGKLGKDRMGSGSCAFFAVVCIIICAWVGIYFLCTAIDCFSNPQLVAFKSLAATIIPQGH